MSIGSFDVFTKIKKLLNFGTKENTLKRKAIDPPEYINFTKYRRVNNDFPKIIHKPFEDDATFVHPNSHTFMGRRRSSDITPEFLPYSTPVVSKIDSSGLSFPNYADLEFSDDEDEIICTNFRKRSILSNSLPSSRFTRISPRFGFVPDSLPIIRTKQTTKMNHNNNITEQSTSFETKNRKPRKFIKPEGKPIPALIEARTGQLTTCIPPIVPLRKNQFINMAGTSKQTRETGTSFYCGSENPGLTNGGFSTKEKVGNDRVAHSLVSKSFNLKEKAGYLDLLKTLVPALYKPSNYDQDRQRTQLPESKDFARYSKRNFRHKSKVDAVINLIDGDELQTKEIIDLSDDDFQMITACNKIDSEKKKYEVTQKELPKVEPVNTLRDKLDLAPTLKPQWLENFTAKYTTKNIQRKKQIHEEEENVRQLSEETKKHERLIEQRLKDFMIHTETIILDDSETEEEVEFPEFTDEERTTIKRAMYGGSQDEVLVSKFNMNITRRDISTLFGDTWLNDEVINFYMNLLMDRGEMRNSEGLPRVYAMNTFFIPRLMQSGHSGVRRWTRKVDIFSYDIIPVPVHVGQVHWCMAIIHLKNKTIRYYDSMGTPNPRVLNALEEYLKEESLDKKKQHFDTSKFQKESVVDAPRQMNGSDCGVFSCMFAEYITRNREITFSQQHMPYFRQKMVLEIVQGKLQL